MRAGAGIASTPNPNAGAAPVAIAVPAPTAASLPATWTKDRRSAWACGHRSAARRAISSRISPYCLRVSISISAGPMTGGTHIDGV